MMMQVSGSLSVAGMGWPFWTQEPEKSQVEA